MPTNVTERDALETLRVLLNGAGLAGFSFGTCFTLRFEREVREPSMPWSLELRIDTDWWFGARDAWQERVAKLGAQDLHDPEEAVQAYDLVRLRWGGSARIDSVEFLADRLVLRFGERASIHIASDAPEESWELVGQCADGGEWLVTCEFGEVFVRSPDPR